MDKSKEYIKQCEKAIEIQPCLNNEDGVGGTWVYGNILYHTVRMNQPHDRDGYYHVTDEMAVRKCKECGNEKDYIKSSRAIWLPRQDQLQDMLAWKNISIICSELTDFACSPESYEPYLGSFVQKWGSMEQLWLAFVMKEKYNKVWDGEEWIPST